MSEDKSGESWTDSIGLTKLEWYAGMALPAVINRLDFFGATPSYQALAHLTYDVAEAMIAESEKRK